MSETVLVTYAEPGYFAENRTGSKFYYRDEIEKDKWQDLMDLYNLQDGNDHVKNIHTNQKASELWCKWLINEDNFKNHIFDTRCCNISKFYHIFIFLQD